MKRTLWVRPAFGSGDLLKLFFGCLFCICMCRFLIIEICWFSFKFLFQENWLKHCWIGIYIWERRVWYFLFFISLMSRFNIILFNVFGFREHDTLNSFCLNLNPTFLCSGLPWWLREQRICLEYRRSRFSPWVGKIP